DLGDSTDKPLFAVAANFLRNDRHHATANNDLDDTQWSGDLVYKYRRFSVVGEYHYRESQPETGAGFKDRGWLAQASYAFKAPRHGPAAFWEIAFRYAEIDPSSLRPGDRRKEIGGALGYYYNRHNLKVQADFRNLKDDAASSGEGTSNNEARLQAQLIF
ncbi:MAG TPA: porin, partial [Vicinamibacteria bacterium]|nr:porin [Vicinamibacteria bacterium]